MNFWLQTPLEFQVAIVAILGAIAGGQVNRGIYRLAWFPRQIGPWSQPLPEAVPRRWFDRIPIVGWIGMRREATLHGPAFWLRPMLIEIALAIGLAWLYASLVHFHVMNLQAHGIVVFPEAALGHFLRLGLLLSLMTVATFIDLDEKTIPDAITVPGTLLALFLSAALPDSALGWTVKGKLEPLLLTSPLPWPVVLQSVLGLVVGIAAALAWCAALIPKTWTTRLGWRRAIQFAWASTFRSALWWKYTLLGLVLSGLIAGVWLPNGAAWQGLLSALVGMFFGGALVWVIRIVAGSVLDKEAMGFGDVTLMAMIGAALGWQASLIVFFLAPFAALFFCLALWLLTRRREIAFGPYLCLSAVVVSVCWDSVWERSGGVFAMGWQIPLILLACLVAMGVMLYGWRAIEDAWFRSRNGAQDGRLRR